MNVPRACFYPARHDLSVSIDVECHNQLKARVRGNQGVEVGHYTVVQEPGCKRTKGLNRAHARIANYLTVPKSTPRSGGCLDFARKPAGRFLLGGYA